MASDSSTIGDMTTWWAYVRRHSSGAANAHIATRLGISPPSVGRWARGENGPDPEQAANFARSYGRPVLEAFVAAGFLTADEAGELPSATPSLAGLTDRQLLDEVERRMKGERAWGSGNNSGSEETDSGNPPATVTELRQRPTEETLRPDTNRVASRPSAEERARRKAEQQELDQGEDENQDPDA